MSNREYTPEQIALEVLEYSERIYRSNQSEHYLFASTMLRELLDLMHTDDLPFERIQAFASALQARQHLSSHAWNGLRQAANEWIISLGYPPFWSRSYKKFDWPDELMRSE